MTREELLMTFFWHKRGSIVLGTRFLGIQTVATSTVAYQAIVQTLLADGFITENVARGEYQCAQSLVEYFQLLKL